MFKKFILALIIINPFVLQAQLVARSLKATNGQTVGFYEFTPSDYSKTGPKHPLLIFLHGQSEKGNGTSELDLITKVGIPKYIKNGNTMRFQIDGKWQSFVVLMPQLSPSYGSWQLFYTNEMINYAIKNLNVDENRIYLTGLSLGGGGVWSYASSSPANAAKLAAIVPVCGTCNMSNAGNIVNQQVAVWAFHGDKDTKVSADCSKNAINAIKALKPSKDALLTLYNTNSHIIWDQAYDFEYKYQKPNVWEWMLKQTRNGSSNKPPVVNAGADQTITLPTNSVTLSGSASDPDGTIASYQWSKISGPGTFTIESPNSKSTKISNLVAGTYVFRLTAKNNAGAMDYDDVTVKVNPAYNQAPVANAGKNQDVKGTSTVLDGTQSHDPDGSITKAEWRQLQGPATATIVSPTSLKTNVTNLNKSGFYVFRLTVTDNAGATAYDDIGVTVNSVQESPEPTPNKPPVANAGPDQTITGTSVKLDGSGSSDPDGSISKYEWSLVSGPSSYNILYKNNKITEVNSLVPGKYTFRLTVYDNKQASSYDDVVITVNDPKQNSSNKAPIADAGPDQTISGSSVILNGSGSKDPDGSITKYEWQLLSGPTSYNILYKNNKITEVNSLVPGKYTFRLTVYDDKQASGYDDVVITVNDPKQNSSNKAPIADAGSDQTISGSSVKLNGSGSKDPDGSITKYQWKLLSGPTSYNILYKNNKITDVVDLVPGQYTFRLTVYDDKQASGYDDVVITVTAPKTSPSNQAPIANAGPDQSITGTTAKLDGAGSKDLDGSITKYEWSYVSGPSSYTIVYKYNKYSEVTDLVPGKYTFRLTVYDDKQASAFDDVIITVNGPQGAPLPGDNEPPVANAGQNATISASTYKLDGSKSYDPDGSIVKYEWTKVSGPASYNILNKNNKFTNVTDLTPGTYIIRLTVWDNKNASSYKEMQLVVTAINNQAAITSSSNEEVMVNQVDTKLTDGKISIYPNPATSVININATSAETGNVQLKIYDLSGRLIKKENFNKAFNQVQRTVNINDLKNGIYYVELIVNNKRSSLTKFIKQ